MLFPTFTFFIFFVVVLIANWLLKKNPFAWKVFLLLISYFFYATWDARFLILIFSISLLSYWGGLLLGRQKKIWLIISVGSNVLILAFFKYFNFFQEELAVFLAKLGFNVGFLFLHVVLPVGLSFYVLRAISYLCDVFYKKISPEPSFLNLAVYLSFFPQLLSGPISRAKDFLSQLKDQGSRTIDNLEENMTLILSGLLKKVVIASYLTTALVDDVFAVPQNHSQLAVLLAIYAFAIVIYCDFSGYSDMAIGLAGLMGFKSPANFASPYLAVDFQDFWKRWHITLSNWLRDYVYIPLGGSRKGRARTYLNLLITMFVSGLWHGTGLQFIVWGLFHGLGLAAQRFKSELVKQTSRLEKILSWFITLNMICLFWVFFRAQNLQNAFDILKQLFNWQSRSETINIGVLILVPLSFLGFAFEQKARDLLIWAQKRLPLLVQILFLALAVIVIIKLGPDIIPPFIYFKF